MTQGTTARILVKLEYFGPSGSVKDRILPFLVSQAEQRGDLKPGMTIIEATTGNTGIATAMTAAAKGYAAVIVMPEGMSDERKKTIQAYGARSDSHAGRRKRRGPGTGQGRGTESRFNAELLGSLAVLQRRQHRRALSPPPVPRSGSRRRVESMPSSMPRAPAAR